MTVVVREAWAGLLRNRTRSLLSMLGISWGIVSVVVLLAYGEGFKQALLRGFRGAFGDGVSINFPGQTSRQAEPPSKAELRSDSCRWHSASSSSVRPGQIGSPTPRTAA